MIRIWCLVTLFLFVGCSGRLPQTNTITIERIDTLQKIVLDTFVVKIEDTIKNTKIIIDTIYLDSLVREYEKLTLEQKKRLTEMAYIKSFDYDTMFTSEKAIFAIKVKYDGKKGVCVELKDFRLINEKTIKENSEKVEIQQVVKEPFYNEWWFYVICGLVFLVLMLMFFLRFQ